MIYPDMRKLDVTDLAAEGAQWQGKVALVTGATGAFGSACARALAARGATVVLAGRRVKELERIYDQILAAGGAEPAIYPINFEGASGVDYVALAERVNGELGGIDALVWAVGHWHGMESTHSISAEQWLKTMHINTTAPWLLLRELLPKLRARHGSALFPLAPAALTGSAFAGAYGAAQAALRNWVASCAQENERLMPRIFGVELPPLRSRLRLAAFPAEDKANVVVPDELASACTGLLGSQQAPGIVGF